MYIADCYFDIQYSVLLVLKEFIIFHYQIVISCDCKYLLFSVKKYKLELSNLFLIHDDLDKKLGKFVIKEDGSARYVVLLFKI